jgi:hypothetical protein
VAAGEGINVVPTIYPRMVLREVFLYFPPWPIRERQQDAHALAGHTGITRHSPRNGFNGLITFANLDASVGVSGAHDFFVRDLRRPLSAHLCPPHPAPWP